MSKAYYNQNMETENHRTGNQARKEPFESIMFVEAKEIVPHAKPNSKLYTPM